MAVAVSSIGGRLSRHGKFKHKRRDGWRVGDADVGLSFIVTAKHIADGTPGVAFTCAAALALKAQLGKKYDVIINRGIVKVIDIKNKLMMRFATGARLATDYRKYDKGVVPNFEPGGVYELLPVPGWLRIGTPKKPPKASSGDPPKRKRALPRRWIIGMHNVELLRDHPFFRAHIRPEDR